MRPFLVWRDDWLLGHAMLDEQHLVLANTINELHCFLASDQDRPRVGMDQLLQRLASLLDMTRCHFQDEEELMQESRYLQLTEHHREHAMLLAEIRECMREIGSGNRPFSLEALTALKHWLIDHVLNSDRRFVDYLCRDSKAKGRLYSDARLANVPIRIYAPGG